MPCHCREVEGKPTTSPPRPTREQLDNEMAKSRTIIWRFRQSEARASSDALPTHCTACAVAARLDIVARVIGVSTSPPTFAKVVERGIATSATESQRSLAQQKSDAPQPFAASPPCAVAIAPSWPLKAPHHGLQLRRGKRAKVRADRGARRSRGDQVHPPCGRKTSC